MRLLRLRTRWRSWEHQARRRRGLTAKGEARFQQILHRRHIAAWFTLPLYKCERVRAPNIHEPRDVPRCGALNLLQKAATGTCPGARRHDKDQRRKTRQRPGHHGQIPAMRNETAMLSSTALTCFTTRPRMAGTGPARFLPFNLPTPLEFCVLAFGGVAPEK
jgi:hypothetical protein